HLEAVANANDELFRIAELAEGVAEKRRQLGGEDLAGGHIVAVGEAAGDCEDVVLPQQARVLAEAIDMNAIGPAASSFEGELRFLVAVSAGGAEHECGWGGHAAGAECGKS